MVLFSLQGCHWSIWRLWLPLVSLITSSHHGGRKHWRFTTTQTAFWRLCVAKPNIHQTRNTKSDIISLGFKPRIFRWARPSKHSIYPRVNSKEIFSFCTCRFGKNRSPSKIQIDDDYKRSLEVLLQQQLSTQVQEREMGLHSCSYQESCYCHSILVLEWRSTKAAWHQALEKRL